MMYIQCPSCGESCEVDFTPEIGQHIICPFCKVKFSYGSPSETGVTTRSVHDGGDAVPTASSPAKKKVVFDFNRCEQELSARWHRKAKPVKFKWTKGKIAFWSLVVVFNLVFIVFGLPTCLEEWQRTAKIRDREEAECRRIQSCRELRIQYEQLLSNYCLIEMRDTGWRDGGKRFVLSLTSLEFNAETMIVYDVATEGLEYFLTFPLPKDLARKLVEMRLAIANGER